MRLALKLVLFVTVSLIGASWAAEVYKWKDGKQVTNYSQLPPARGVPVQRLRTGDARAAQSPSARAANASNGTPGAPGAAPELTPAQQELRAKLDAEEKTRLGQIGQQRQSQCQNARAQFDQLTQYARMRVQNDDGKVRVMPEEERQRRIQEAKARIVEFCVS